MIILPVGVRNCVLIFYTFLHIFEIIKPNSASHSHYVRLNSPFLHLKYYEFVLYLRLRQMVNKHLSSRNRTHIQALTNAYTSDVEHLCKQEHAFDYAMISTFNYLKVSFAYTFLILSVLYTSMRKYANRFCFSRAYLYFCKVEQPFKYEKNYYFFNVACTCFNG